MMLNHAEMFSLQLQYLKSLRAEETSQSISECQLCDRLFRTLQVFANFVQLFVIPLWGNRVVVAHHREKPQTTDHGQSKSPVRQLTATELCRQK